MKLQNAKPGIVAVAVAVAAAVATTHNGKLETRNN